jgi:hypothetical protein
MRNIESLLNFIFSSPNFFDASGEFLPFDPFGQPADVSASDCTFKITPKKSDEKIFIQTAMFSINPENGKSITVEVEY